jgi:hypothetical protein
MAMKKTSQLVQWRKLTDFSSSTVKKYMCRVILVYGVILRQPVGICGLGGLRVRTGVRAVSIAGVDTAML